MIRTSKNLYSGLIVLGVFFGLLTLCVVLFKGGSLFFHTDQQYLRERLRIKALNSFMPSQYKDFVNSLDQGQPISGNYEIYYKAATELMPSDFSGHYLLGLCYQSHGQWEQAIAAYQTSLRLYPGFFWTYYNVGIIYWQTGQKDLALSAWSAALRIPPQATFKAFLSQKLLNDCLVDLKSSGYDPGLHIQKGYEDLARWIDQKSVPENLHTVLF